MLIPQMSSSLIEKCIDVEVNLYCNALKFYQVLGYQLLKPDILEKPGFLQIRLIVSGIEKFLYKIIRIVDGKHPVIKSSDIYITNQLSVWSFAEDRGPI